MMEGTRDYPGTVSPYELDIIHKVGLYKIAFEKGKKMYGPELAICNNYFLIITLIFFT